MGTFAAPMRTRVPPVAGTRPPAGGIEPDNVPPESTLHRRSEPSFGIEQCRIAAARSPAKRHARGHFGLSNTTAVTPLSTRDSCALPTRRPAISVMRLWRRATDDLPLLFDQSCQHRPLGDLLAGACPRAGYGARPRSAWMCSIFIASITMIALAFSTLAP